jgi:NDP-sugar pyrophosphorylase family protein
MKALVLAAGKGTRLGTAAGGLPKPLTAVGGTTPLQHAVAWVAAEGPECIWINVHEHAAVVRARIGRHKDAVPIRYSHEPELLGTAGAWKKLEREWSTTSLVVYGDNLMRFDLRALQTAHERSATLATVALFDPRRHANTGTAGGRARLRDGLITEFVEGGTDGLVSAGVYCLEPELAARLPSGFLDFGHDVLPDLARSGRLAGHVVEDGAYCLGIDDPERLEAARSLLGHPAEAAS